MRMSNQAGLDTQPSAEEAGSSNTLRFTPNSLEVARSLQNAWGAVPENRPLTRNLARDLNIHLSPLHKSGLGRGRARPLQHDSTNADNQILEGNDSIDEDNDREQAGHEIAADDLYPGSAPLQYFKLTIEGATAINEQLLPINQNLGKLAETVENLKKFGRLQDVGPVISNLTGEYVKLYAEGQTISQSFFKEVTEKYQDTPPSLFTPTFPQWREERQIVLANNQSAPNEVRSSPLSHLTFQPLRENDIRRPQAVRGSSDGQSFRPIRTPIRTQNQGNQDQEILNSVNRLQQDLAMSMRLQQDLASVNGLPPFTATDSQSPMDFVENFNRAVYGTALTDLDKKRCFMNLIKVSVKKWGPSLKLDVDSLNDYQEAFLKEYFSADAQMETNAQFMTSKPPTKRTALLEYYDEWYEKLSYLTKPKRDVEEILLELTRKAPEVIKMGLRANRYKTYGEFRQKVKDLTFGIENLGGRTSPNTTKGTEPEKINRGKYNNNYNKNYNPNYNKAFSNANNNPTNNPAVPTGAGNHVQNVAMSQAPSRQEQTTRENDRQQTMNNNVGQQGNQNWQQGRGNNPRKYTQPRNSNQHQLPHQQNRNANNSDSSVSGSNTAPQGAQRQQSQWSGHQSNDATHRTSASCQNTDSPSLGN